MRYVKTDETGRIGATTEYEEYAEGMEPFDFPDNFDFLLQSDYRIVDGELVHDPLPPTEEELEAESEAKRREQMGAAAVMFVRMSARTLTDGQALEVSELFEDWDPEEHYESGDVRRYAGELWRCRQAHDAQPSWTPDQAHGLWGRIVPPGEVEEWRQPQPGIFDGYEHGQRVTWKGKTWESTYNGINVWEPGAPGSEALWKQVD